jgi:hypothetical protein
MLGFAVFAGALAIAHPTAASATLTPPKRPAHYHLVNGAKSIDALLASVLDALAKNDSQALNALRVTEREYCDFILPGAVAKGEQPKAFTKEASAFAWGMLNTKSLYAADAAIDHFGGKHFTIKDVRYAKGQRQYAWYDTYNTTVLTLEDDAGGIHELTLGSIAQIDGQFKFVGLLGSR